jgi:hypothetical protein
MLRVWLSASVPASVRTMTIYITSFTKMRYLAAPNTSFLYLNENRHQDTIQKHADNIINTPVDDAQTSSITMTSLASFRNPQMRHA